MSPMMLALVVCAAAASAKRKLAQTASATFITSVRDMEHPRARRGLINLDRMARSVLNRQARLDGDFARGQRDRPYDPGGDDDPVRSAAQRIGLSTGRTASA